MTEFQTLWRIASFCAILGCSLLSVTFTNAEARGPIKKFVRGTDNTDDLGKKADDIDNVGQGGGHLADPLEPEYITPKWGKKNGQLSMKTKPQGNDNVRAVSPKKINQNCEVTLTNFLIGIGKKGVADELGKEIVERFDVDDATIQISQYALLTPKHCFTSIKFILTGKLQSEILTALRDHPAEADQKDWSMVVNQ